MRVLAISAKYIWLFLCLLLVSCAEDISDPLSIDDFSDILSSQQAGQTSDTGTSDTGTADTGTIDIGTSDTGSSGIQITVDVETHWVSSSMQPGGWAEYTVYTDSETRKDRLEYIGKDTYNGVDCYVTEIEMDVDRDEEVAQIWSSQETGEVVLVVYDDGWDVVKIDNDQIPEFLSNMALALAHGQETDAKTLTTRTGKTVQATVYKFNDTEVWLSEDIPFRLAKLLTDDKVDIVLYNFDSSGATADIEPEEAKNAIDDNIVVDPGGGDDGIIIAVGDGVKPTIIVSEPIRSLVMIDQNDETIWMFQSVNQTDDLEGPFQYGVLPKNAEQFEPFDGEPPDLIAGNIYQIVVMNGDIGLGNMGVFTFIR